MPRRLYKYKLLLDENMPNRNNLPLLNKMFDVKHISSDFKRAGIFDPEVYKFALQQNRFIITRNVKDFKKLASLNKTIGIIGISENLPFDQVDKKLTSLLTKSKKSDLFGKFTYISGETAS